MGNAESQRNHRRKPQIPTGPIIFPVENLKPPRRSYRVLPRRRRIAYPISCFEDVILENHPDGAQSYGKYTRAQKEQAMNMVRTGMSFHEVARQTGHGCSPCVKIILI